MLHHLLCREQKQPSTTSITIQPEAALMSELCGLREVSTATTHSFSPPFPVISMNPHLGVVVVFVFQLHMTSEMNNDFLQSFLQGHFHTGLLIEMKFISILSKISPHFSNEYRSQNIIILYQSTNDFDHCANSTCFHKWFKQLLAVTFLSSFWTGQVKQVSIISTSDKIVKKAVKIGHRAQKEHIQRRELSYILPIGC